ncbi:SDR family NAD(P)-dependent oxidoreductase, partial [Archangium sp.]|uniref:SDR family NAD(P)-dependent oxidoreductase n=1 Tax=Archangium sp. TaxID=1872627 RepID=UPI002ED94E53
MAGRVEGKVALVTGAASGLGKAMVQMLAREGARVAVTDRNEPGARDVAGALGEAARSWKLDVTQEADWQRVVDEVL